MDSIASRLLESKQKLKTGLNFSDHLPFAKQTARPVCLALNPFPLRYNGFNARHTGLFSTDRFLNQLVGFVFREIREIGGTQDFFNSLN